MVTSCCSEPNTSYSCFGNGKDDKILKKYIESLQIQMQCLLPGVVVRGGASVVQGGFKPPYPKNSIIGKSEVGGDKGKEEEEGGRGMSPSWGWLR